jgi:hypothetical protein
MAGRAGLDPGKMPFSSRPPSGPGSPFYRHTKLINTTWIEFDLACSRPDSPVELVQALPEWEMSSGDPKLRRSKKPWEKFLISEQLEDIDDPQRRHVVRPDALFLLAPRSEPQLRVAAFLEADRATVSSSVIMDKILGYWHIFLRRSFERWGALAMRVLFVVGSVRTDQRIGSMLTALGDFARRNEARHERFRRERLDAVSPSARVALEARLPNMESFVGCFRFCRTEDFAGRCIVTSPIWRTAADGERVPFFRGPAPEPDTAPQPEQGGTPREGTAASNEFIH